MTEFKMDHHSEISLTECECGIRLFLHLLFQLFYIFLKTLKLIGLRSQHGKCCHTERLLAHFAVMQDSTKIGLNNVFTREKFSTPFLDPPSGMVWVRDAFDSHEWTLVDTIGRNSPCPSPCSTGNGETIGNDNNIHHVIEHVVLPTDTFLGICLAYKLSAIRLRQLNRFSGANLALAPRKLLIPVSRSNRPRIKLQNHNCLEFKLYCLLAEVPRLSKRSAQAYLTMAKFDLYQATHAATSDFDWEDSIIQQVRDRNVMNQDVINQDRNFDRATFGPTSTLNIHAPCNKKQKRNEELLEMNSMNTDTRKQKPHSTLMLDSGRYSADKYNCDEEFCPLPYHKFSRKIEVPRMQFINTLLTVAAPAISNVWFHVISFLEQSNKSPRLVEYEMNELHRGKS